ncbi:MAG: hypothetical protein Q7R52_04040 [archaeon]|nr:hypothetical protein [archaeon]
MHQEPNSKEEIERKIKNLEDRSKEDSVFCRLNGILLTIEQVMGHRCYLGKNGCTYCPNIELHYGLSRTNYWKQGKIHGEVSSCEYNKGR